MLPRKEPVHAYLVDDGLLLVSRDGYEQSGQHGVLDEASGELVLHCRRWAIGEWWMGGVKETRELNILYIESSARGFFVYMVKEN